MIEFVNAKINIGLQIVRKREDGYHDLQTVFYPVGIYAGTPENPEVFGDILELSQSPAGEIDPSREEEIRLRMPRIELGGKRVDCEMEKNLVWRAAREFIDKTGVDASALTLRLEKHLPFGAGMGGGSADASFTLRILAKQFGIETLPLEEMALRLGADCPFFIRNRAVYAEGVGEKMSDIDLNLGGYWLVAVKPDLFISTKEAFAGVRPKEADFDLRRLPEIPIREWRVIVKNDFEVSLAPRYPIIGEIKERLYKSGALYAAMTGSGSVVYGIYGTKEEAVKSKCEFAGETTIEHVYLLKL